MCPRTRGGRWPWRRIMREPTPLVIHQGSSTSGWDGATPGPTEREDRASFPTLRRRRKALEPGDGKISHELVGAYESDSQRFKPSRARHHRGRFFAGISRELRPFLLRGSCRRIRPERQRTTTTA